MGVPRDPRKARTRTGGRGRGCFSGDGEEGLSGQHGPVGTGGRRFPARMIKGLELPELPIGHSNVIIVLLLLLDCSFKLELFLAS